MKKDLYKLLYKSFETDITPDEKKVLDLGMQNDPDLKKIRDDVSSMRQLVKSAGRENFPSTFEAELTAKVNPIFSMRENQVRIPDVFTVAFRKVSISGALVLLILLLYNLKAGNDNILKNFLDTPTSTMKLAYDPSLQPLWTDTK
jgi:hypothetical protein